MLTLRSEAVPSPQGVAPILSLVFTALRLKRLLTGLYRNHHNADDDGDDDDDDDGHLERLTRTGRER